MLLEETGEPVPGWEGEITEVPKKPSDDPVYLVELDAPSLKNLPERYLADKNALNQFMAAYNINRMNQVPLDGGYPAQYQRPAQENPFKPLPLLPCTTSPTSR